MSLLVDITANALDGGYADAAARRREAGADSTDPGGRAAVVRIERPAALTALAALVLAGGLFATSAVATHRSQAAASKVRAGLLAQVDARTATIADQQNQLIRLRADVASARDSALSASGKGAALRLEIGRLDIADGATPVQGAGAQVVLDDAKPSGNARTDSLGTIYDRDVQAVVNALFASGAEAIAVNGQRLSAQTAIREAGSAILVDYRPLSPPYRIDAIGPPDLGPIFLKTQTGSLYQTWRQVYGLQFSVASAAHLTLPAASNVVVHYAKPMEPQ
jgi:uncharacterized protein YlxW (UPF0749 family)